MLLIPFEYNRQMFLVRPLRSVQDVIDMSDFLLEGWKELCNPHGAKSDISWDNFLKKVMNIACGEPGRGGVFIQYSKNQKPLGFMVVGDDSETPERKTVFIWAGYTNGKCKESSEAGMDFVETWARKMRFVAVRAQSMRINGAAMRLFRKKLGFKPRAIVFEKEL